MFRFEKLPSGTSLYQIAWSEKPMNSLNSMHLQVGISMKGSWSDADAEQISGELSDFFEILASLEWTCAHSCNIVIYAFEDF